MAKPTTSRFSSLKSLSDKNRTTLMDSPDAPGPTPLPDTPPPSLKVEAPRKTGGRPAGKRSNPDFRPVNLVLRKQTQRDANRRLEDDDDKRDLSELVEDLLAEWLRR